MIRRWLHDRIGWHQWHEFASGWHSLDGKPPSLLTDAIFLSEFECRLCGVFGYGKLGHRVSFVTPRQMTPSELRPLVTERV
jgi:hypothetical protein